MSMFVYKDDMNSLDNRRYAWQIQLKKALEASLKNASQGEAI